MLAAVALLPWAPAVVAAPLAWAQRNSPPLRVLFVGNSLTFTNDLPAIVAALADSAGRAVTVRSVTASGINLDAHWRGGTARRLLASEPWDVVVLQQGPSAMPASRAQLAAYARRFAAEIRRAGARPALYMVWPSRRRLAQLDEVRESYRLAARDVDGIFLPAGEAWRAAWRRDPSLPLYGPDGRHPSATGSYLAALVIAGRLLDRAPDEFPPAVRLADGRVVGVTASQAAVLEAAAAEALGRWR
ncbi:MAG TPA: SGNH/GDSL hydrolase family protein [Gemmatimonadales bacterium]|nr:SGNH/GDSL hydrolase family protein [Gemmatimonadales bacterium]